MLNKILPLMLCIIFMYSGCKLFTINEGRTNDDYKEEQKALCEKGVKTVATLQNEYTEMEVGSSVSYQYKFDYMIDGKNYTGKISKKEELEIPVLEITYNPDSPDSYTTTDACKVYAAVKDNPSRKPQWFEYIGAGMFLLALGFIKSSVVRIFTSGNPPAV